MKTLPSVRLDWVPPGNAIRKFIQQQPQMIFYRIKSKLKNSSRVNANFAVVMFAIKRQGVRHSLTLADSKCLSNTVRLRSTAAGPPHLLGWSVCTLQPKRSCFRTSLNGLLMCSEGVALLQAVLHRCYSVNGLVFPIFDHRLTPAALNNCSYKFWEIRPSR